MYTSPLSSWLGYGGGYVRTLPFNSRISSSQLRFRAWWWEIKSVIVWTESGRQITRCWRTWKSGTRPNFKSSSLLRCRVSCMSQCGPGLTDYAKGLTCWIILLFQGIPLQHTTTVSPSYYFFLTSVCMRMTSMSVVDTWTSFRCFVRWFRMEVSSSGPSYRRLEPKIKCWVWLREIHFDHPWLGIDFKFVRGKCPKFLPIHRYSCPCI